MPDLSKSPERIAGMFDAIAPRYDLLNRVLSLGIDRRWRRRAIRRDDVSPGMSRNESRTPDFAASRLQLSATQHYSETAL